MTRPLAIDVRSPRRGELDGREALDELDPAAGLFEAKPQVAVGRDRELAVIAPTADALDDRAPVQDRRRRPPFAARNLNPAARRNERDERMREIRAGIERSDERREMVRQPEIVVAEVGDELAAGLAQSFVVRTRLMTAARDVDRSEE